MNNNKPLVINLIGGPGSGKSTTMAGVFYRLKKMGVNCELVTEYVKDKVWEEQYKILDEQIYVLGRQHHKIARLVDKVDVVIMDTTLLSSIIYDKSKSLALKQLCLEAFNNFNNMVFFIDRSDIKYEETGRIETPEIALSIDQAYKDLMEENNIPYTILKNDNAVEYIIQKLINEGYIK